MTMHTPRASSFLGLLLITAAGYGYDASAQGEINNIGVPRLPEAIETKPAEADPMARVIYGGSVGMMYSDNIYRSNSGEESDWIAVAAPGLRLRTDLGPHEAEARLRVEGGAYLDNGENDYVDVRGNGRGKYAISDTVSLVGDMDLRRDHVAVGAFVDNPDRIADEPTVYHQAQGAVGVEADDGRYYGLVMTGLNYLNYDNADARGTGVIVNDDRDRTEWNTTARAGAYVVPGWLAYVQGSANTRNYRTQIDSTALMGKDSDGYGAAAGMAYGKEKEPTHYDVNIGYISQDYDHPMLADINTLGAQATARWRVSDTVTLKADAVRGIEENTLFGASGHTMTRGRVGAEYAVAPQWTIGGDLRFTHNDFEMTPGVARGRKDDILDASALVEYNIAGDYYAGVEYVYVNRDSTDSSVEYTTNAVLTRLSLKY